MDAKIIKIIRIVILKEVKNLFTSTLCIQFFRNTENDTKREAYTAVSSFKNIIIQSFCPILLFGKLFDVLKCFKQVFRF